MNLAVVTVSPIPRNDRIDASRVIEDWMDNKDFLNMSLQGGTYVNKSDINTLREEWGIKHVKIRYSDLREFVLLDAKTWQPITGD